MTSDAILTRSVSIGKSSFLACHHQGRKAIRARRPSKERFGLYIQFSKEKAVVFLGGMGNRNNVRWIEH